MATKFVWLAGSAMAIMLACSSGTSDDASDKMRAGGGAGAPGGGGTSAAGGEAGAASGADSGLPLPPPVVEPIEGVSVSTLAGSAEPGLADGPAGLARFNNPVNVAVDAQGNLLVCDFDSGTIRSVSAAGVVSTLVNQPGFRRPFGITVGSAGAVFVQTDTDTAGLLSDNSSVIWQVDTATGAASPIAQGLRRPRGLAQFADGRLFMTDRALHVVHTLTPGTGELAELAGVSGEPGFGDGTGSEARFDHPYGAVRLPEGGFLIADQNNHALRRVDESGQVTTIAGNGSPGMVDGLAAQARFNLPRDLAIDAAGNVYISDLGNHRVRRMSVDGVVQTIAGDGEAGFADGTGEVARFYGQEGLDISADGKTLYVADGNGGDGSGYHRVRMIVMP